MKYTLHAILPDGQEMVIRSMVDREEAEEMAEVLCRVTEQLEEKPPRREGNTWYVVSKRWRRNGRRLCWLDEIEGEMMSYFQRFETTNPKVGLAVMYELRRNPAVLATAYIEGVHLGRHTLPLDVWQELLQSEYLAHKYGLTSDEITELAGLWHDFEVVAQQSREAHPHATD